MLFNEPKLLKFDPQLLPQVPRPRFSALQRAEIAEIKRSQAILELLREVSVLFNEPKLLKSTRIARRSQTADVSVLFNEPKLLKLKYTTSTQSASTGFSALQRAEIAEIALGYVAGREAPEVSVLFNEPKLLKSCSNTGSANSAACFSALQRAEIAEISPDSAALRAAPQFQCSSTSRNC